MINKDNKYMNKEVIFLAITILLIIFSLYFVSADISIGASFVKVTLSEDGTIVKPIVITAQDSDFFYFSIENIQGVSLSSKEAELASGQSFTLELSFNSKDLKPGLYVGNLRIKSSTETTIIPIVFEIESSVLLFDANLDIPPVYVEVAPGDKLIAQLKIFDLISGVTQEGAQSTNVDVDYFIYRNDGTILSSESEKVVVFRQTQLTKSILLPKDITQGDYILGVVVTGRNSVGVSSSLFSVAKKNSDTFGFFKEGTTTLLAVLIIVAVFFIGLIVLFIYIIKDRDNLLLELRKYNQWELKRQMELLEEQKKIITRKKKDKEVTKEIKKKVKELKKRQDERVREFKRLEKKGQKDIMKKKLIEWKKAGYNTLPLEYKMSDLSASDMQSLLEKWKKKYSTEDYKNKG